MEKSSIQVRKNMQYPRRAGIIPFSLHPVTKNLWFCLAKDSKTLELGDFGGGVKCYESPIKGAVREFTEETLGVFGYDYDYIASHSQFVIKRKNASIFFVRVPWEIVKHALDTFRDMYSLASVSDKNHEVCDMVWLPETKFNDLLKNGKCGDNVIWGKVKAILSKLDISKIQR